METQATIIRVNLHESDHGRRRSLMNEVLDALRRIEGIDRVSVLRGIAGLNGDRVVHAADIIHFDVDLPLMVEFSVSPEVAPTAIEALVAIVPPGHVLSWPVTRHGPG